MSELIKHSTRRSRKPTKICNVLDFVVIRRKTKQSNKTFSKKITFKRIGKVRRKKPSTIKKRIIRERKQKIISDELIVQKTAELKLDDDQESGIKHSRNFREYCDHFLSPEIHRLSESIIKDLFRFQENKFQQNPTKAKANRRYVVGFKEVKKFLIVEKIKLIFISPDLERNSEVDKLVEEIKLLAVQHKSPYIFGIKRRKLGYLLLKKVPVSIVGVFSYQGVTESVEQLLDLVEAERINFKNKTHLNT